MVILTRKSLVPTYANHLFIANTIIAIIGVKYHSITHALDPVLTAFISCCSRSNCIISRTSDDSRRTLLAPRYGHDISIDPPLRYILTSIKPQLPFNRLS
ncbi:Uncharacterized protein HZ326_20565 [Fusarium oxysporum f. sp. albedinis]|nr:Uncharacterized protein HZ326_20565 [Fusarium oxysporum f. sp. albedinis]